MKPFVAETIEEIIFQDLTGSMSRIIVSKNEKRNFDIYLNGYWIRECYSESSAIFSANSIAKRNQ